MNVRLHVAFSLLAFGSAIVAIAMPSVGSSVDAPEPFKITAEIISQRDCPTDGQTYAVIFKLRTKFVNQTNRKLIVGKDIGSFIPHLTIGTDAKHLSDGNCEWYTNEDWTIKSLSPETSEQFKTPGS